MPFACVSLAMCSRKQGLPLRATPVCSGSARLLHQPEPLKPAVRAMVLVHLSKLKPEWSNLLIRLAFIVWLRPGRNENRYQDPTPPSNLNSFSPRGVTAVASDFERGSGGDSILGGARWMAT